MEQSVCRCGAVLEHVEEGVTDGRKKSATVHDNHKTSTCYIFFRLYIICNMLAGGLFIMVIDFRK
jgi:hypothetical protein